MMNSGIYLIQNVASAKFYVGSAVSFKRRWSQHKSQLNRKLHTNRHLQNAWNKHGAEMFRFYKVEACSKEQLVEREQFYIDTLKPEYNIAPTAGNCLGVKHTEEVKRNMSEAAKKRWQDPVEIHKRAELVQDPEWRRKNAEANKKKAQDPEYRCKLSESKKKLAQDVEWRRKNSVSKKKKAQDPEWRRKNAEANKKKAQDPKYRRKLSESIKKKAQDPEYRRKLSESKKKLVQDPEWRRKNAEAREKMYQDFERNRKISEAKKLYWAQKRAEKAQQQG